MQKRVVYGALLFLLLSLFYVAAHDGETHEESATSSPSQKTPVLQPTPSQPIPQPQNLQPNDPKTLKEKVDLTQYGCKDCKLDAGTFEVTLNKQENLLSYKEDKAKLSEFPEGTQFIATEQGLQVILPKKLTKMFEGSSFVVDTGDTEIELPNGEKFKGVVSFRQGELHVLKGNSATVANILVASDKNDVTVAFGKVKDGITNYVNLGSSLEVQGDGFTTKLLPGNKYVTVEQGDFFALAPQNNGKMILTPRTGKTPHLEITGPASAKEWGTVWNGQYKTTFGGQGIVKNSIEQLFGEKKGTVPLQVDVVDAKGNLLIKDKGGKPYTLVYDNNNRQFILPTAAKINADGSFICPEGSMIV